MGSTKIESPTPPQPESTAESMQAYIESMPALYEAQMKYDPLLLQRQLETFGEYSKPAMEQMYQLQQEYGKKMLADEMEATKQYLPELTKLQYETEGQLYPETQKLQEELARQSMEGMTGDVPDWMRQQYLDELRANLGTNVGSGIGADYTSRALLQQNKDWQDYYRDLGLSVTGRLPLKQASGSVQTPQVNVPQYGGGLNWMQGYQPAQGLNYSASTYSPYASAYSSMYNTNAQTAAQGNPYFNALAGMGGTALGGWMGGWGK